MERLRELHHSGLVNEDNVAYVMISVDGERDTPAAMNAFLAKYSSDFIGLTADPNRVTPIAQQFMPCLQRKPSLAGAPTKSLTHRNIRVDPEDSAGGVYGVARSDGRDGHAPLRETMSQPNGAELVYLRLPRRPRRQNRPPDGRLPPRTSLSRSRVTITLSASSVG
jgi:hypothetical protein